MCLTHPGKEFTTGLACTMYMYINAGNLQYRKHYTHHNTFRWPDIHVQCTLYVYMYVHELECIYMYMYIQVLEAGFAGCVHTILVCMLATSSSIMRW